MEKMVIWNIVHCYGKCAYFYNSKQQMAVNFRVQMGMPVPESWSSIVIQNIKSSILKRDLDFLLFSSYNFQKILF